MSDILVTGGRGFIGTNLTNELRSRGHSVWTCDILQGHDDKHYKADVAAFRQMESIFMKQSFDYVYHLAAEYGRWNGEDHYENLWRTNVVGTKHLLQLQVHYKFRMVFFSSAEVYGDYDALMT
ncbi:MAG: NAD(P)-dependent oxidoreductase, partial [Terracidiphilus sp.]